MRALGSFLAGFLYDHFHTYHISFYMVILLMLAAIVGMRLGTGVNVPGLRLAPVTAKTA
ncbi:MAG: hypothetical protein O7G88_17605 [bacterium]|nr:hypothetical protein [bacterium]